MNDAPHFSLELEQVDAYEFLVRFDLPQADDLLLDEPPPLGDGKGPNPARLVAAAVASCLSSSLVFCMGRFHETPGRLRTTVTGEMVRNERGRLRLGRFDVTIHLPCPADAIANFDRCTRRFEDYCIVTESVRRGIDVGVRVVDGTGHEVWADGDKGEKKEAAAAA
jgi:organic hydroperoxide reductase OsmC/OhrA